MGRGYAKYLEVLNTCEVSENGMLRVEGKGRAYNKQCNWQLVLDPSAGYLVRSAKAWSPENGFEYISVESKGTEESQGILWASSGVFWEAGFPNRLQDRFDKYEVTFADYSHTIATELLDRCRRDLRTAIPIGTEIYDYRGGDGDSLIRDPYIHKEMESKLVDQARQALSEPVHAREGIETDVKKLDEKEDASGEELALDKSLDIEQGGLVRPFVAVALGAAMIVAGYAMYRRRGTE